MAAFREHVTFSTVLGTGYGAALWHFAGAEPSHAILAAGVCGVSGMLPDLDSASGKPVREMFGLFATVGALGALLVARRRLGLDPEAAFLAAVGMYVFIRVILATVFKKITVHRGMFHSLPAAIIVGALFWLTYDGPVEYGRFTMAGAAMLGFLSHLLLDEIYSVDLHGVVPRLNKFAGSALKLYSKSIWATACCWLMMAGLLYQVAVNEQMAPPLWKLPTREVTPDRTASLPPHSPPGASRRLPH